MDKRILICAVIALILVPASVMAAGIGDRVQVQQPDRGSACKMDRHV